MITVSNAAEPVPSEVAAQVARSVVEITAFQCTDGNSRTGSGFVFQKPNQIVSDYHVVQGCGAFRVYFERAPGAPTKNATIARVLPKSDLALLNVSDPPNVPALDVERHPVQPDELYVAIGYSLPSRTWTSVFPSGPRFCATSYRRRSSNNWDKTHKSISIVRSFDLRAR
ncbi:S1 family peptidase [Burkholderia pseudomallei]